MIEYKVKWQKCPTHYNDPQLLFVEAATPADAEKIARNYVERHFGLEWFKTEVIGLAEPMPEGKVK